MSALVAGRTSSAVTPPWAVTVASVALAFASSVSRAIHQAPTTRALRDPTGPPGTHGTGVAGSSAKRSMGKGRAFVTGPSPRRQDRAASANARTTGPSCGSPRRSASTRYCERTDGALR